MSITIVIVLVHGLHHVHHERQSVRGQLYPELLPGFVLLDIIAEVLRQDDYYPYLPRVLGIDLIDRCLCISILVYDGGRIVFHQHVDDHIGIQTAVLVLDIDCGDTVIIGEDVTYDADDYYRDDDGPDYVIAIAEQSLPSCDEVV